MRNRAPGPLQIVFFFLVSLPCTINNRVPVSLAMQWNRGDISEPFKNESWLLLLRLPFPVALTSRPAPEVVRWIVMQRLCSESREKERNSSFSRRDALWRWPISPQFRHTARCVTRDSRPFDEFFLFASAIFCCSRAERCDP